jgi:hypothetical protein
MAIPLDNRDRLREQLPGAPLAVPLPSGKWGSILHRFACVEKMTTFMERRTIPLAIPRTDTLLFHNPSPAYQERRFSLEWPRNLALSALLLGFWSHAFDPSYGGLSRVILRSVESLVIGLNVRYPRHNCNSRNLLENPSY